MSGRCCEAYRLLTAGAWLLLQGPPSSGMSRSGSEAVKRPLSQPSVAASSPAAERTRIKVVLNIGRVELELLRTLTEIRSIEPLARFQVLPQNR